MIGAAAAYMSGSFFAYFFYDAILLPILIGTVSIGLYFGKKHKWTKNDGILLSVAFTVGIAVYSAYTAYAYRPAVSFDGKFGTFSGEVTEITNYENDRAGYVLKGRINGDTKAKITYYGADLSAEYGDIVDIGECRFAVPESDYLFDSENYYKSEGIFLTAASAEEVSIVHTDSRPIRNKAAEFRETMTERLKEKSDETTGAFLSAMLFGEKRQLDGRVKTALYRSGIGHILAVSGLHVSIIAMLFMSLLKWLNVNRFVSYILMNAVLILFVVMADSPISAIRSTIMMDFFYAAGLFRRQNDSLNSLSAASLVLSLSNPYVIVNAGFLLSVSGTFGIAVFAPFMTKNMKYGTVPQIIVKDLFMALFTALSVLPFCVLFFSEASVISPLSNVLLVPLCTAAMINGVIFVLTGGILPILFPARVLVNVVVSVTSKLAEVSFLHISCGSQMTKELLLFLGAFCLGIYFIGQSRKAMAAALALCIGIFSVYTTVDSMKRRNEFIVAILGKGRNAAVVVTHMGAADIIDISGNANSADYVAKYLTERGISEADHLVLTRNTASQYENYMAETKFTRINEFIIPSEDGKADHVFDEGGFSIDRDAYCIRYTDGALTVRFGSESVTVQPASADTENADSYDIRYGSLKKGSEISDDAVYLEKGNNNFEIVLSEKGGTERRL